MMSQDAIVLEIAHSAEAHQGWVHQLLRDREELLGLLRDEHTALTSALCQMDAMGMPYDELRAYWEATKAALGEGDKE